MPRTHLVRPNVPPGTHPIETGRYVLSTPPLGRLCDDLKKWVNNRASGAIVVGPPRFGKTKGIAFGTDELRDHLGNTFPVLSFCCRDYSYPTEGRFFEDLLSDLGHAMSRTGTTSLKRARLTQFLIQQACAADHRRLVLIGDEAQKLHEQHYKWLVDIYNELDRHDICTTVVLVGQPETGNSPSGGTIAGRDARIGLRVVVGIDRRRASRDWTSLQPARIEIGIHHGHLLVAGRALAAATELGIAVDRVYVGRAPVQSRGLDLLAPLGIFRAAHNVRREYDQQLGATGTIRVVAECPAQERDVGQIQSA